MSQKNEYDAAANLGIILFSVGCSLGLIGGYVYFSARIDQKLRNNDIAEKITSAIATSFATWNIKKRVEALEGKIGIADAVGTKTTDDIGKV